MISGIPLSMGPTTRMKYPCVHPFFGGAASLQAGGISSRLHQRAKVHGMKLLKMAAWDGP